jgi:hypothetical protein
MHILDITKISPRGMVLLSGFCTKDGNLLRLDSRRLALASFSENDQSILKNDIINSLMFVCMVKFPVCTQRKSMGVRQFVATMKDNFTLSKTNSALVRSRLEERYIITNSPYDSVPSNEIYRHLTSLPFAAKNLMPILHGELRLGKTRCTREDGNLKRITGIKRKQK